MDSHEILNLNTKVTFKTLSLFTLSGIGGMVDACRPCCLMQRPCAFPPATTSCMGGWWIAGGHWEKTNIEIAQLPESYELQRTLIKQISCSLSLSVLFIPTLSSQWSMQGVAPIVYAFQIHLRFIILIDGPCPSRACLHTSAGSMLDWYGDLAVYREGTSHEVRSYRPWCILA